MPRPRRRTIIRIGTVLILLLLCVPLVAQAQQMPSDEAVAEPFVQHYWRYQGDRVLGLVQSPLMDMYGYPVQYFEKGRLEDHSHETSDPAWQLMYGRLTVEMMDGAPQVPINGTGLTYGDLRQYTEQRYAPPAGFGGGTAMVEGGVFVPFDPSLQAVPGYIVPTYFWNYVNQPALFPHGWLHDVGLPLTNVFSAQVVRDGVQRTVQMQAFERSILSYDPVQPTEWQVERVNIGTDALMAAGVEPLYVQPTRPTGPKRIEINLSHQYLYAFEGDFMVYEIPVSTGKPGWETPTGSYQVFSKYVATDMQGDVAGEEWYVPDVPHAMYFAAGGYAIHGTYWHNTFGTGARLSHGCVNLPVDMAAVLYNWTPMGTPVIIYY